MEFSGSNEEGMRGVDPYIRGGTPVARGGGATGPPAAPVGWAQRSPEGGRQALPVACWGGRHAPFFSRDLVANLRKKNYT